MTRFIVTIAPPTPNGDLHVGHISGPYLAADVFARLQKQNGHDVALVSYSDDYQSYLARKAYELDSDPFELGKQNGRLIHETMQAININLTHWLQAGNNPHFEQAVRDFYLACEKDQSLSKKNHATAFFPNHNRYGYEAWARSKCNHCGSPSDASQCEVCACPPDMEKMENIHCVLDAADNESLVVWKSVERVCLDISKYKHELNAMHATFPMREHLSEWLDKLWGTNIDFNWPISRPGEHGVTLQTKDAPIIHTWFSGLGGYLAATREGLGAKKAYELWEDPETRLVHFLGFDCSFSHVLAYPCELLAKGNLTRNVQWITNRFLTLDGEDFSTSRNHAIWVRDLLREATSDAIRLYVASIAPEEKVSDFSHKEFIGFNAHWFDACLPEIMKAADAELSNPYSSMPQSGEAKNELSSLNQEWNELSVAPLFSMRSLAQFQIRLLERLEKKFRANEPLLDLLILFGECGACLHPELSQKIEQRFVNVMVPGA